MTRIVFEVVFLVGSSRACRRHFLTAQQIVPSLLFLFVALLIQLTGLEHVQAQNGRASTRSIAVRHHGPVPYEESRIVPAGKPILSIAGRLYTDTELEILRGSQGVHAHEQPATLLSGADGLIVELREPAVLSVYVGILQSNHGPSAGKRSLSISESRQLDQQYTRTLREQDFVLNRLGRLTSSGSAGPSRASRSLSAPITRFSQAINGFVLRDVTLEEVVGIIRNDPDLTSRVKRVVPNRPVYATLTTSVKQIHAPEVWELPSSEGVPLTGLGTKIGILDTGVDYKHPDLGGCFGPGCKVAGGYDFVNKDSDPIDDHGHGTHCAATAAGDGSYVDSDGVTKPLKGVAPGATIYSYKVLSASGSGSDDGIIKALEHCADPNQDNDFSDRLDVCSLSLGGSGNPDDLMSLAVDATSRAGVVVVVAAGNSGPSEGTIGSPGTARLAITVAAGCKPDATTGACSSGPIATFSSRGPIPNFPDVMKPDIVAPGVDICAARYSTFAEGYECLDGTRVAISGTSMATPHVAGVAALLKQAHPGISPEGLKEVLLSSATDLGQPRESQGAGLVHAYKALEDLGFPNPIGRVDGAPVNFEIKPLQTIVEVSRTVTLTSRADTLLDFAASLQTDQEGVELTVSPQQVALAPGEAATFTLRAVVDLKQVASGKRWRGRLAFTSVKGVVESAVYGLVQDRLTVDASSIDLGIKNGNDVAWKDGKTLRLANLLSDVSTTYKVSVTCCGTENELTSPGFSASAGAPTVEIPPGGTVDVPLTVEATGVKVKNGTFAGKITISSDLQSVVVPVKFYKGWVFRYTYRENESPLVAVLHSKSDFLYDFPAEGARESVFWVKEPGPWQAEILSSSKQFPGEPEIIFKVDQTVEQTTKEIAFQKSEARQMVLIDPRHPDGGGIRDGLSVFAVNNHRGMPYLSWRSASWGDTAASSFRAWINTFTPDIRVEASAYDINTSTLTTWQHLVLGDSRAGDIIVRDGPFITRYISPRANEEPADATKVVPFACVRDDCWRLVTTPANIPPQQVGILHASTNVAVSPDAPIFSELPRTYVEALPASQSESDWMSPGLYSGGFWSVSSEGAYSQLLSSTEYVPVKKLYSKARSTLLGYERGLGLGAGPEAYIGSWYNYPGDPARLQSRYGAFAPSYIHFGGGGDLNTTNLSKQISFSLYRNDVQELSGTLHNGEPVAHYLRPGNYRAVLRRAGNIGATVVQTESETTFKVVWPNDHEVSPVDQNSPTLKHLALVADGLVQNAIDLTKTNTLYFSVDPSPGFLRPATGESEFGYDLMDDGIQSLIVEQSINGIDWSPLAYEAISDGEYKVTIPTAGVTGLSAYRISASDLAGNTVRYKFEVPGGGSLVVPTATPTSSGTGTPTDTPTPSSTPTPPGTATPSSTPTAVSSPTAIPTVSATPDSSSGDSPTMLPKPRASVKHRKWFVSIPRIATMNMDAERTSALTQLLAAGLSSEEVAKYSDLTKVTGECLLSFKRGRKQRQKPLTIGYLRGRRVSLSISSRIRTLRISYSCQFYSAKPYSFLLGPARRSAEVTTGRAGRGRKRRLVA